MRSEKEIREKLKNVKLDMWLKKTESLAAYNSALEWVLSGTQWHRPEEKPENGAVILIYDGDDGGSIAMCNYDDGFYYGWHNVLAWMHLPDLPEWVKNNER